MLVNFLRIQVQIGAFYPYDLIILYILRSISKQTNIAVLSNYEFLNSITRGAFVELLAHRNNQIYKKTQ